MIRRVHGLLFFLCACGSVPAAPDASVATGPQALVVSVTGPGVVTSSPAGIDCGAQCAASLDAGTLVTLTATPDASAVFVGWSGDCAGETPCTLTMDAAKNVSAAFALHGAKRWVKQVSFSGQDLMENLVVDPQGNLIAAGAVDDGGGSDLYLVKYDQRDGTPLWTQHFDTETGENVGGLATDAEGNVYVGTRLSGLGTTAMFGTQTVTGDLFGNIVILKLAAATGAVLWVKQWGGTGQDIPEAIAVAGNDLYVVGYTSSNPSQFDGLSLQGSTNNGFVVRASTDNGVASAAKLLPGSVSLTGVAVHGTDVAVVGEVRAAMALDACNLSPSGAGSDAMILDLLRADLRCRWGKNFGDSTANINATTHAIAAYPGGGWVIAGSFQGNILLAGSGSSFASRGGFDVFVGRFDAAGTHQWSFRYGDTGFDVGYGVAVTPTGEVLLAGAFASTITFGPLTLTGANNTFVTRMSAGATPSHQWAVGLGGDDTDLAEDLAIAPDGSVYVLSSFQGMTNVGGEALTSLGYDAWIGALVR